MTHFSQVNPLGANQLTPQRDLSGDMLRGWAILGVVTIHSAVLVLPDTSYIAVANYFRWAVPVFIILSAYFSVRSLLSVPESYQTFVIRRLRKLIVPFFAYSMLYFIINADLADLSFDTFLTRYFSGYGWAGQYFFIILFQLVPIYPLLVKHTISHAVMAIIISAALVLFPMAQIAMHESELIGKINDRLFVYWIPYAFFGAYLAQHEGAWRGLMSRLAVSPARILLIVLPLLIVFTPQSIRSQSVYVVPSVMIVACVIITVSIVAFRRSYPRALAYLGQHSLVVFCLNPLVVMLIQHNRLLAGAKSTLSLPELALAATVLVIMISAFCVLIGDMLKRMGLGKLVT